MLARPYDNLFRAWPLITFMTRSQRQSGLINTALGRGWLVLNPLAQLGIYYFLIEVVFRRSGDYPTSPALFIIVGITHFLFLQRAITLGASSIFKNEKLLLQVRIEPLVFVAVAVRQAFSDLGISLVLCVGFFMLLAPPHWHWSLFAYPVSLLLLVVLASAWAMILGTLSVYSRDLPNTLSIVMRLLIYATPVIYPISMVSEKLRIGVEANPLTGWFCLMQWSLFDAPPPGTHALGSFLLFCTASVVAAHALYKRLEKRFTKVL